MVSRVDPSSTGQQEAPVTMRLAVTYLGIAWGTKASKVLLLTGVFCHFCANAVQVYNEVPRTDPLSSANSNLLSLSNV